MNRIGENDLELSRRPAVASRALTLSEGTLRNTIMWYRVHQDTLRTIAPASSVKARVAAISACRGRDPRSSYLV